MQAPSSRGGEYRHSYKARADSSLLLRNTVSWLLLLPTDRPVSFPRHGPKMGEPHAFLYKAPRTSHSSVDLRKIGDNPPSQRSLSSCHSRCPFKMQHRSGTASAFRSPPRARTPSKLNIEGEFNTTKQTEAYAEPLLVGSFSVRE